MEKEPFVAVGIDATQPMICLAKTSELVGVELLQRCIRCIEKLGNSSNRPATAAVRSALPKQIVVELFAI